MYQSNGKQFSLTESEINQRTEVVRRLYDIGLNLIPMNGKTPCVGWKRFQTERVTEDEIRNWLKGNFISKNGNRWTPDCHNFAILTGAAKWSNFQFGIVVVDADDEEAVALVKECCPATPMMQRTSGSRMQFVFRHPGTGVRIPNRTKTTIEGKVYNLDIRGDGGYILCPMSIHPRSGTFYKEIAPWTLELLNQCRIYDPSWIQCERHNKGDDRSSAYSECDTPDAVLDHGDVIFQLVIPFQQRIEQAKRYMAAVPGTQVGTGADRKCTALAMTLLYGFALPPVITLNFLVEWGKRNDQLDEDGGHFPWETEELERKINWCLNQEYNGTIGDRLNGVILAPVSEVVEETISDFSSITTINPKNQLEVATQFLKSCFCRDDLHTLVHYQATWHQWNGKRYDQIDDADIKARLWKWLSGQKVEKKKKTAPFKPTRTFVSNVLDALKAIAHQPSTLEAPCWLTSGPSQVISFDNGILDVDHFLATNEAKLLPHTPNWFSPNCLPHKFDPIATCPNWLDFLDQVFDRDDERINALKQWFGYNLIADNRFQKIALLYGPPRSGKGTTIAVLTALLGRHNIANLHMSELAGSFSLEPMIGKTATIIDECHLGKSTDSSAVLDRLKAISGNSDQSVNRKNLKALPSVSLKVRFTLSLNEMPRLSDSSAALRSRLLLIPYFNSYVGKEDIDLVDRLLKEISGISNWALDGLKHLMMTQRFHAPSAGIPILQEFEHQSSPVKAFLDECCVVNNEATVGRKELRQAWINWCLENGHFPGSTSDFGKKLRSAVPRIINKQIRVGETVERVYVGIGISPNAGNGNFCGTK